MADLNKILEFLDEAIQADQSSRRQERQMLASPIKHDSLNFDGNFDDFSQSAQSEVMGPEVHPVDQATEKITRWLSEALPPNDPEAAQAATEYGDLLDVLALAPEGLSPAIPDDLMEGHSQPDPLDELLSMPRRRE